MDAKGVMQSLCTYPDEAHFITELRQTLRWTLFSSGLRISPRRVNQIGQEITGRYVNALLEGYMVGREASVLREQARTMRAL
jgi:hypothetical protein